MFAVVTIYQEWIIFSSVICSYISEEPSRTTQCCYHLERTQYRLLSLILTSRLTSTDQKPCFRYKILPECKGFCAHLWSLIWFFIIYLIISIMISSIIIISFRLILLIIIIITFLLTGNVTSRTRHPYSLGVAWMGR